MTYKAGESSNDVANIFDWAQASRPNPDNRGFHTQLGVHFEEVAEMAEMLQVVGPVLAEAKFSAKDLERTVGLLKLLAQSLKTGALEVAVSDRENMCRELCDQVVTAVAVGQTLKMAMPTAVNLVNKSNWSKFVDGKPVFDANGKVVKGPDYKKHSLSSCV